MLQIWHFQAKSCILNPSFVSNPILYPIQFYIQSNFCIQTQIQIQISYCQAVECFLQTVILCNKSIMQGANSDNYYATRYQSGVSSLLFRCKKQLEK